MTSLSVGGTGVAVDITQLRALAVQLDDAASPLREAALRVPMYPATDDPHLVTLLADVRRAAVDGLSEAETLAVSLRAAALELERAEAFAAHLFESMMSQVVAASAAFATRMGLVLAPGLLRATVLGLGVWNALPQSWREQTLSGLEHELVPVLSHPAVLSTLRSALRYVDDAALGAAGVPPSLVTAIGDQGLGLTGLDSVAAGIAGLATFAGAAGIAPVVVRQVGADVRRGQGNTVVDAPVGIVERVARIPGPETPIVIERFERADGSVWFEVYVAGTDGDAPLGGAQPWDGTSNIANAAGLPSSSLQAVRAALLAAGAVPGSEVVFTGYSQWGAIATTLAESGDWTTLGLVTIGAPSGGTPVTGDYPALVIEHRDDIVPVLGGPRAPTNAVVVVGDALGGDHPAGSVLPAHEFERYESTAADVDASEHPDIVEAIAALPATTERGTRTVYTAERITPQ